jgi:serine/threonine protein kinase
MSIELIKPKDVLILKEEKEEKEEVNTSIVDQIKNLLSTLLSEITLKEENEITLKEAENEINERNEEIQEEINKAIQEEIQEAKEKEEKKQKQRKKEKIIKAPIISNSTVIIQVLKKPAPKISYLVPEYFIYKNKRYINPTYIGTGTYGVVLKYNIKNEISNILCLKISRLDHLATRYLEEIQDKDDGVLQDVIILKCIINTDYKNYNIIESDYVIHNDMNYLIMEYMPKTIDLIHLEQFDNNLLHNNILQVIKQISQALLFLSENNICYTDLTTNNILYKITNDQVIIKLTDLGSACMLNEEAIAVYPALNRSEKGIIKKATEKDVVWSFGVLIIRLYNIDITVFQFDNVEAIANQIHMPKLMALLNLIKTFIEDTKFSFLKTIIKGCFDFDPNTRFDLKTVNKMLLEL